MISPRPAPDNSPLKPEFPSRPFFGVELALLDEKVSVDTAVVFPKMLTVRCDVPSGSLQNIQSLFTTGNSF